MPFMRPSTVAILVGILLMIVALVAWMSEADDGDLDNTSRQPWPQAVGTSSG
jgi:hypothetical protein